MSVSDYFSTFNSNLRMSTGVVGNISARYKQITKRLNLDFWNTDSETSHSLYVGSYGRATDIVTSDIDMIFILPYALYTQYNAWTTNGQSGLLQAVVKALQKTYSSSYLGADGQVIKLNFTDGINFEIVPAFELAGGTFKFPDTNSGGSWKITNPTPEISAIRLADMAYNNNVRRLCRMARSWKYQWDVPMGGLLIDTLAHNFMKNWSSKDKSYLYYDWMTRDFFKYLSEQNKEQTYWLALGSGQVVYRRGLFEAKAKKCYELALEAIEAFDKAYYHTAKTKWREIYGTKFPA